MPRLLLRPPIVYRLTPVSISDTLPARAFATASCSFASARSSTSVCWAAGPWYRADSVQHSIHNSGRHTIIAARSSNLPKWGCFSCNIRGGLCSPYSQALTIIHISDKCPHLRAAKTLRRWVSVFVWQALPFHVLQLPAPGHVNLGFNMCRSHLRVVSCKDAEQTQTRPLTSSEHRETHRADLVTIFVKGGEG